MEIMTTVKKALLLTLLLFCFPLYAATVAYTTSTAGNSNVSDPNINSALLAQIAKNPLVSSLNVSISTHNGVVSLQGIVNATDQASEYIALAASVPGVIDVDASRLTTQQSGPLSTDLIVSAKVKGALVRGKAFGDVDIDHVPITITMNNGIVYLKGIVDSTAQMIYAIKIAQSVPGVPRVISELTVRISKATITN